ncbi:hypothetical protein A3753_12910 [Sulfitobacter sp. HI0082]|nr:hypothetical protein A3753_12910 [Sulfitobacter sp. HI0082]
MPAFLDFLDADGFHQNPQNIARMDDQFGFCEDRFQLSDMRSVDLFQVGWQHRPGVFNLPLLGL